MVVKSNKEVLLELPNDMSILKTVSKKSFYFHIYHMYNESTEN